MCSSDLLPGAQGDLIQAVYAANPKTVVVLVTAGPLAIDWAKAHVPAMLAAFYDGPVWRAHRDEANATMIDSDDVLLLRPWQPFDLRNLERPPRGRPTAGGR